MGDSFLQPFTFATSGPAVSLVFSDGGFSGPFVGMVGTVADPLYQPPGQEIPGQTVPPGQTTEPPRPPHLPQLPPLTFNHTLIPRLTNRPSRVFNLAISSVSAIVGTHDLSACIKSLDWSTPLNGVAQGNLELWSVAGINLNPDTLAITQGTPIEISYRPTDVSETLLARCYVVGSPRYFLNQSGTYQLNLEIGDELALLSNTTRNRGLYCGLPPKTVGEFANIYASLNGLKTRSFPTGHELIESTFNNFYTESPWEILSKLYSVTGRDVRTNPNGLIICPPRSLFNRQVAKPISYRDVIESEPTFTQLFEPFTRVKASNNYKVEQPFSFSQRSFTRVTGDATNRKPWFQGGYQETITTITSYGDTDIHTVEETRAYVPVEPLPWPKALMDQDPCAIGGFTTVLSTISRKTRALQYYQNGSTFIVSRDETWENGLKTFTIESGPNEGDTSLFNGLLAYTLTTYTVTPQPSALVCQADYIQAVTRQRTETYAVDSGFDFRFTAWQEDSYTPSGASSSLGQPSFTGVEQTWSKTTNSGEYVNGAWIVQPTRIDSGVNPPSAQYIRPASVDVVNFSEYQLPGTTGVLEPVPLSAPFCYDAGHLNQISDRYLREQYGLSRALTITTPSTFPLALGESVLFTNRLGEVSPYTVWSLEHNLTGKDMSKTFVLMRAYE